MKKFGYLNFVDKILGSEMKADRLTIVQDVHVTAALGNWKTRDYPRHPIHKIPLRYGMTRNKIIISEEPPKFWK